MPFGSHVFRWYLSTLFAWFLHFISLVVSIMRDHRSNTPAHIHSLTCCTSCRTVLSLRLRCPLPAPLCSPGLGRLGPRGRVLPGLQLGSGRRRTTHSLLLSAGVGDFFFFLNKGRLFKSDTVFSIHRNKKKEPVF